ncbi:MAG: hypothetical protein KDG55_01165 [Rhodocyclaceae bacterium]|nr:hypothetical protein [Rhodocyclaceae bacterium]
MVLLPAALAACSLLAPKPDAEIVKARAEAFYKARLAGDAESAYSFAAPSYRAVTSLDRFRQRHVVGTHLQGVEVVNVECESQASVCTARTRLDFVPPPVMVGGRAESVGGVQSTYRDERWIKEDGGWWRYFDPLK